MKKIIVIFLMVLFCSGCSLVKTITTPFKPIQNSLPQQTDKSKLKETCKGEVKFNENGDMIYCSKGYYNYEENYAQKERKLTIKEKIIQFFEQLSGHLFWVVILLVIFCPSLLGFIFGRVIEGVAGVGSKTLKSVIRAVQNTRKNGKDLNQSLETELDTENKKYIAKIKEREKIK